LTAGKCHPKIEKEKLFPKEFLAHQFSVYFKLLNSLIFFLIFYQSLAGIFAQRKIFEEIEKYFSALWPKYFTKNI